MRKLKIGYWPLSKDLDAAGDRRRIVFWAKKRGHEIVTDLTQRIDVIVASEKTDFRSKIFNSKKIPLVFDLVDAYLCPKNPLDDLLRGVAKRVDGQISSGLLNFSGHIKNFCSLSDSVICSSPEQEKIIKTYNTNTHIILDSHEEIPFRDISSSIQYSHKEKVAILWEGQPATLSGFNQIRPIVKSLAKNYSLKFSFVTDKEYFRIMNKYLKRDTVDLIRLNSELDESQIAINHWSPVNLVQEAERSFLAIIPMDLSTPLVRFKPENRLLIMWRLGLPCLTSASPSYIRVSNLAGTNAICDSPESWQAMMLQMLNDPSLAKTEVLNGQAYVRENHNETILLKKWDAAVESAMTR